MPRTMRHDEVSELLGDYARGDLDAAAKASVDEHLADCRACTSELKAVASLRLEHAPLSDIERSRLHREVGQQVAPAPGRAGGAARRSWAARLAPGLGAATLLALVAVGAAGLFTGGDEDGGAGDSVTFGRAAEKPHEERAVERDGGGGDKQVASSKAETAAGEEGVAGDEEGLIEDAADPDILQNSLEPTFEPTAAPVAEENLARFAVRTGFERYDWKADADQRSQAGELFLAAELSRMAPKSVRDQVRSCVRSVRSARKERVLATYGTLTKVGNRPSLVLGFIWQGPPQERPGYMLWAWPRGSCDEPLAYSASGDKR